MMSVYLRYFTVFGLLIFAASAHGCAARPENTRVMLSEEVQSTLDNVGVIAVGTTPEPEALGPVATVGDTVIGGGAGLLIGTAAGLGVGLIVAASMACGPLGLACAAAALTATTVGAVAGTTTGVIIASDTSLPSEIQTQLSTALADALLSYDLPSEIKNHVVAASAPNSEARIVDLGRVDALPSPDLPEYQDIMPSDVDTVLELGLTQIALVQIEEQETDFSLLINMHGALTALAGQETIWSNDQMVYVSTPANMAEWTAPKGAYLRTEINQGLRALSREISIQIFGERD